MLHEKVCLTIKIIVMAEHVNGINPDILKWARERSGYTVETIATALKKEVSIVNDWELGERALTYVQLETLADKYKRPIAIFFFPEPPEEPNIAENPTLRSSDNDRLDPGIHILLRQAYARQISLMELNLGTNPSEKKIFRDLQPRVTDSPTALAQQTRVYLNISINQQTKWSRASEALDNWRDSIEENGIFVFKDAFKDDSVDGFCLVHDEFPVIYLNNSRQPVRQIFSLFHELGHLLLGENGITRRTNPISGTIEAFCNQFASECLVPSDDLETQLNFSVYDDKRIEALANRYKVSRPVILLKLVNRGILTQEYYSEWVGQWNREHERHIETGTGRKQPSGGNYHNTHAVYLGYRFIDLAFSKYRQGYCSIEQLAEYLSTKVKHLPELEDRLSKRALR